MKRWLAVMTIACLTLVWAGAGQAEENAAPKKTPPKPTKLECEIVSVDVNGRTIEIQAGDKCEKLVLSEKCKIRKDGKEATLADLKAGDKCTCSVFDRKDGTRSVSRIVVGTEPPKQPKKKAAE